MAMEERGIAVKETPVGDRHVLAALDADGVPVSTIAPGSPARIAMNDLLAKLFTNQQEKN